MADASTQAAYEEAIGVAGVPVTFLRLAGVAPHVTTTSAAVTAVVRNVLADTTAEAETGYGASQPGSVSQDDRLVIVLAADLAAAGFPLPVVKGDKIMAATGDKFQVTKVDAFKRAFAGALELTAVGVA